METPFSPPQRLKRVLFLVGDGEMGGEKIEKGDRKAFDFAPALTSHNGFL